MLVYKSIIEPFCAFGDFKIKNKIPKIIINFVKSSISILLYFENIVGCNLV